jgi:hypothetical protein
MLIGFAPFVCALLILHDLALSCWLIDKQKPDLKAVHLPAAMLLTAEVW